MSVNGIDLRNLKHNDAVKILTDQEGQVRGRVSSFFHFSYQVELELLFISPEESASSLTRLESHDVSTSMGPAAMAKISEAEADELPEVPLGSDIRGSHL